MLFDYILPTCLFDIISELFVRLFDVPYSFRVLIPADSPLFLMLLFGCCFPMLFFGISARMGVQ